MSMPKKFSTGERARAARKVQQLTDTHHKTLDSACREVANQLGVTHFTLRSWHSDWLHEPKPVHRPTSELTTEELVAENARLRAKIEETQRETELLRAELGLTQKTPRNTRR